MAPTVPTASVPQTPRTATQAEFQRAVHEQSQVDAQLRKASYTGAARDGITGQWNVWLAGKIVGTGETREAAETLACTTYTANRNHASGHAKGKERASVEPQALTLARETRSSIELTRNAKGDYQWTVKLYVEDGAEDAALATLAQIDATLRATYLDAREPVGAA